MPFIQCVINQTKGFVGIIEDDQDIANLVKRYLEREGLKSIIENGTRNWESILSPELQLIILDWMLPDQSGLEIVKKIRSKKEYSGVPIIMLTARVDDTDVVRAFESGVDDFVAKPFSASVLMARVNALLRRSKKNSMTVQQELGESLCFGLLKLDPIAHKIFLGDDELFQVTLSEYKLLETLIRNPGKVLTRNQMIECLKGPGITVVERTIDNHVLSLRKKLGSIASQYIQTVRGVGYRLAQQPTTQATL